MKLIKEENRIVLKDHNYSSFFGGLLFAVMGGFVAFLFRSNLIAMGFGLIFVLAGLWMLASTKIITVNIDKGMGKLSYSTKGIIGSSAGEYPFNRIKSVRLDKFMVQGSSRHSHTGHHHNSAPRWQFILNFMLDDGNAVPFEFGSVAINLMDPMMGGQKNIYTDAQMIADFVGVPLQKNESAVDPSFQAQQEAIQKMQEMSQSGKIGFTTIKPKNKPIE